MARVLKAPVLWLVSISLLLLIAMSSFAGTKMAGHALGGIAYAATHDPGLVSSGTDPVTVASEAPDQAIGMIETYGPLWAGLLLAYGLASSLIKRNESKHWLAQGRVLAGISSSATVLGAVLIFHFRGGDVGGLLATIYGAVMAFVHPPTGAEALSDRAMVAAGLTKLDVQIERKPEGGFARLVVPVGLASIALIGCLLGTLSCAALKSEAKAVENGVVACVKADKAKVQAVALQLGTEVLTDLVQAGKVDRDKLVSSASAAGKAQGLEVAACAFGGIVADIGKLLAGSVQGLVAAPDPTDDLNAAFSRFRLENGVTRVDL